MRKLSSRTAGFTDSVIRRMTRVSQQYGAVNLSHGFPDFDLPRELTDDDKTVDERKSSPLGLLFDLFDAPRLCLACFFSPRAV